MLGLSQVFHYLTDTMPFLFRGPEVLQTAKISTISVNVFNDSMPENSGIFVWVSAGFGYMPDMN